MSTENQIHLKGDFQRDEAVAAAAITPGDLIELTSADTVQVHSTEGGRANLTFAEIDALQGKVKTDAYSSDDLVSINIENEGNECQAFLKVGENVNIGDLLISAGDGTLIANGSESSGITVIQVVAMAREAKDLSGSGAVDTLIRVQVRTA